ncbi:MAG: aldehyde dehydrogenase family protein, partial [Candidatus Parvarchaeum sp.]
PLTCNEILRLAILDPEMPKGVVNAVIGQGDKIGSLLIANEYTRIISFTGSTEVGQKIASLAGSNVKKVLLELGGKSPSLVFRDANLEKAIPILVRYMFGTAGQNCMAVSRVLVEKEIFNKVEDLVVSEVKKIRIGNGLDPNVQMGPVISKSRLDTIAHIVSDASLNYPNNLVYGGFILQDNDLKNGFFYSPTVFSKMPIDSNLVQTEIFGPVVSLEIFEDDDQAIEMANATSYGLTASVWTSNHNRALYCASNIQAGTVWINTYMRTFPEAESGGMKKSGIGRSRGKSGIYEYMELKNIVSEAF